MSQRAASNVFQRSLGRLSARSSTKSSKGSARTYSSSTTTGGQPRYDVTGTTLVLAFIASRASLLWPAREGLMWQLYRSTADLDIRIGYMAD